MEDDIIFSYKPYQWAVFSDGMLDIFTDWGELYGMVDNENILALDLR